MKITVEKLIKLLSKYNKKDFVQLDFDTTNLNIRSRDYVGDYNPKTEIDTISLPTEYDYMDKKC